MASAKTEGNPVETASVGDTQQALKKPGIRHLLVAAPSDFEHFPFGGTLSLVRDLISRWGAQTSWRATLVGLSRMGEAHLHCVTRRVGAVTFPFLPVCSATGLGKGSVRLAFVRGIVRHGRVLRDLQPDLIYAHSPESALALSIVCRRKPIVLHCHGVHNPLRLSRFRLARGQGLPALYEWVVYRPALSRARAILVNADAAQFADFVTRNHRSVGSRAVRLPATVDVTLFRPVDRGRLRSELGLAPNQYVAVFVGRIEPPKGLDLVLHAVKGARAAGAPLRLLVIGEGTQRRHLELLSMRLGLGHEVMFLGQLDRRELPSYLSASDVFVSGTLKEAVSMALLEALACGIPGVVTNAGGARELIVDGWNGYVLASREPMEMSRRLVEMASRREEVSRNCLSVAKEYDADRISRGILALFDAAVSTMGSGSSYTLDPWLRSQG